MQRWLVTATVGVLLIDATVVGVLGADVGGWAVAREFVFAVIWLIVGVVAERIGRPALARIVLSLALVIAASMIGGLRVPVTSLTSILVTISAVLVPLQTAMAGHVLLAFPQGAVPERGARRLVGAGYALSAAEMLVVLTGQRTYPASTCPGCAHSLLAGDGPWPSPVVQVLTAAWLPLVCWFAVVVLRRYGRATPRQRRILRLPYLAIAVTLLVAAVLSVAGTITGTGLYGSAPAVLAAQAVALAGVPLCFLIGLLQDRLAQTRVAGLVRALAADGSDVQTALATALNDPMLRVGYSDGDRLLDAAGRQMRVDPRLARTPVGPADRPLAVLVHDRTLAREPSLLAAAVSASWFALENARLNAVVQAQLSQVRASRARLVAASDEARRRVERDLHDGAQQRLLAVGLALQMLDERLTLQGLEAQLMGEAKDQIRDASRELRELANGIHPAVLTEQGLFAALAELAGRSPIDMGLTGDDPRPLPPAVEAAVYFAVSEAVTNAAKHSGSPRCTVQLRRRHDPPRLAVDVVDRGVGGADPAGTGLRGIADRLAVVDGTMNVHSPAGDGTTVHLEVPCAS